MPAKELQSILEAHARTRRRGESAALATVVKTAGSTYRRPGARMFVEATGNSVGSVSGGCLEADVRERALEVIATGEPQTVRYDTTANDDIVWGTGLGCNGVVHVLIEPLAGGTIYEPLACVERALRERRAGVLTSVFQAENAAGSVGGFLWLETDATAPSFRTNVGDPELLAALQKDARAALRLGRSRVGGYTLTGGGTREAFIDFIAPARALLVFGGGHDAVPLVGLAKELGWRVRVVDHRREFATGERFPSVDEVIHCPARNVGTRVPVEPGEAAVIMTHHYLHDLDILRALLASPAGYIGLLGPRRRKERLLHDLGKEGSGPLPEKAVLRRVHGPAGLDIGAEAPEQIALAILAEIEAVSARRRGGLLRRRRGALHDAVAVPATAGAFAL